MAVVMSVLALAGCGTKKEETITLTLWHSFGSTVSQDVIDDYIEMYEKEHPNIKIVQETAQIEEYQFRKLKVAVANNSQGDVFLSYGGGYS
jgi:raffinose/stachyose/melibiose transport system substrate-binding protein